MESDNHLKFIFIFMLMAMACIIGEINNRALTEKAQKRRTQTNKDKIKTSASHQKNSDFSLRVQSCDKNS